MRRFTPGRSGLRQWCILAALTGGAAFWAGSIRDARLDGPPNEIRDLDAEVIRTALKPVPPSHPALSPLGIEAAAAPHIWTWRRDFDRLPRRLLDAYLAKPERWRDELVPILSSYDVPPAFLYLALIESEMDPFAESPAAAAGLWQFSEATAIQYGLTVDEQVDERLDWRRSTRAASRYLRDLHARFGTWELAAAAYNAGPGRVSRALTDTGATSYWELIEAGRLPAETRDYVPKFLAVVVLAEGRRTADLTPTATLDTD